MQGVGATATAMPDTLDPSEDVPGGEDLPRGAPTEPNSSSCSASSSSSSSSSSSAAAEDVAVEQIDLVVGDHSDPEDEEPKQDASASELELDPGAILDLVEVGGDADAAKDDPPGASASTSDTEPATDAASASPAQPMPGMRGQATVFLACTDADAAGITRCRARFQAENSLDKVPDAIDIDVPPGVLPLAGAWRPESSVGAPSAGGPKSCSHLWAEVDFDAKPLPKLITPLCAVHHHLCQGCKLNHIAHARGADVQYNSRAGFGFGAADPAGVVFPVVVVLGKQKKNKQAIDGRRAEYLKEVDEFAGRLNPQEKKRLERASIFGPLALVIFYPVDVLRGKRARGVVPQGKMAAIASGGGLWTRIL
eukprot:g16606.t1